MALESGADPGFPVGGGANPRGGRQHTILPNFPKNCMKLRKVWSVGGAPGVPPLDPPLRVFHDLSTTHEWQYSQLRFDHWRI